MKETLARLIELQTTDDALTELRVRIDDLHKGLAGAQGALDKADQGVAAAHDVVQHAQAALHSLENDLAAGEQKVKTLDGRLNSASSNKEFSAIKLEIATFKAENGKLEERILMSMDEVDEKQRLEEAALAVKREAEADLRAAEARLEEQRQGLETEFEGLESRRGEIAAAVDPGKLKLYDRIRGGNRKSGTAVVAVHGEYCQGCQMAVRPQDLTELVKGEQIILCRSCQRILVLEI